MSDIRPEDTPWVPLNPMGLILAFPPIHSGFQFLPLSNLLSISPLLSFSHLVLYLQNISSFLPFIEFNELSPLLPHY